MWQLGVMLVGFREQEQMATDEDNKVVNILKEKKIITKFSLEAGPLYKVNWAKVKTVDDISRLIRCLNMRFDPEFMDISEVKDLLEIDENV